MTERGETTLNVALIHHPVINKRGEIIGSAVTNLDIHDIARTARTFGVAQYIIATPYADQQNLVKELLAHWESGHGATYNPARKEALSIVRLTASLHEAIEVLTKEYGRRPMLVTTSAQWRETTIDYKELQRRIAEKEPILLVFGTAHGLAPEIIGASDATLPPIKGSGEYNHLSVRSAVSIILDRLLGS